MDLKWNPGRGSHPASAAIRESDLSWRGNVNPTPLIKHDGELLMEEYLSLRKLKALTGVDDLQQVKVLKMRVDTRENSLGSFGDYLPNLRELKLNNSLLVSVRDLGTTLSHLEVLWMTRCGLPDLDGISSCSSLKELYIAYNNISDLSQLIWLDHLQILDLEGNNIEDINQMHYLGLCSKLSHLTVEGNLICLKPNVESPEEPDYNYRAEVKKLIPHLEYLDGIPASQTAPLPDKKMHEDWLIINELIKEDGLAGDFSWLDSSLGEAARQSGCGPEALTTSRPGTAQWSAAAGRTGSACLSYSGYSPPGAAASGELSTEDSSSELTHGLGQVMCGNPTKALRARRQKLGLPSVCGMRTENLHSLGGEGGVQLEDAFCELRVQSDQHKWCPPTSQQEEAVQVPKVALDDGEEDEDCSLTDSSEEELRVTSDEDITGRISLDSSCHSCLSWSSSDSSETQEGAASSNLKHCLIPSPPKNPASATDVAERSWRTRNRRISCLKIPSQEEVGQWTRHCQSRAHQEASAQPLGKDLALQSQHSLLDATGSQGQGQAVWSTDPQTSLSGPAADGPGIRSITGEIPPGENNHHQSAVCSSTEASGKFGLLSTT